MEGGPQWKHEASKAACEGWVSAAHSLTQGSVHMVRLQSTHGCHRALWAGAQWELRAEGLGGTWATPKGHHLQPPLPYSSPLTLALPAPGPMGFMMVYMFSLELVESGEDDA